MRALGFDVDGPPTAAASVARDVWTEGKVIGCHGPPWAPEAKRRKRQKKEERLRLRLIRSGQIFDPFLTSSIFFKEWRDGLPAPACLLAHFNLHLWRILCSRKLHLWRNLCSN